MEDLTLDPVDVLLREIEQASPEPRLVSVLIRYPDGSRWELTAASDVRTPDGTPIPLADLAEVVMGSRHPWIELRSRYSRGGSDTLHEWETRAAPTEAPSRVRLPTGGRLPVSLFYE